MFVEGAASHPPAPEGVESFAELDERGLDREIGLLAAHISAAMCRWLLLVAEFERRRGHERFGFRNCASWLAWRCSIAERAAYENMRVARALGELPAIRRAFAEGRLSYSKVRALTRAAEPQSETDLLCLAEEATAAQLERIISGYRRAMSADEAEDQHERRHLSIRWEDDGMLRINGALPAEEGALLEKAIELIRERMRMERTVDALADGSGARATLPAMADAIVEIAEATISGEARPARPGGERHQVVVHVDLADIAQPDAARANGEIGKRGTIAPETVRRLGCDASIVTLVERNGEPLSVGRKTRSIPSAIGRALKARDRGCRFPGCSSRSFLDAHHVEHWSNGGATSLSNLVQLCGHHHRLVHEGGFGVEMVNGEPRFRRPDGSVIESVAPAVTGSERECRRVSGSGPIASRVDGETIAPRSRGESFDLGLTVMTLASRREPAAALS